MRIHIQALADVLVECDSIRRQTRNSQIEAASDDSAIPSCVRMSTAELAAADFADAKRSTGGCCTARC